MMVDDQPRPLLEVSEVSVRFPGRRRGPRAGPPIQAVTDVSVTVERGTTLGIVGESGSGKSTLGRAILQLVPIASGRVVVDGHDLGALSAADLRRFRRRMHLIYQDPYSSLDPSLTVEAIVAEPLDIHGEVSAAERRRRVIDALVHVGLGEQHLQRYPSEFSGGQRQRIAIARAIISSPDLVVCDEAVSALDVSTQGQVVNLLEELRRELGLTFVFIAHDLAVVRHISDEIAVMYLGSIVERGPADRVMENPGHPYTASLLSAIPRTHPAQPKPVHLTLTGELPDPSDPPSGCRFHTRCPFVMDRCRTEAPTPVAIDGGGTAACHLHDYGPRLGGASVLTLRPSTDGPRTDTGAVADPHLAQAPGGSPR